MKNECLIHSSNLANSLKDEPKELFWAKVKKQRPKSRKLPNSVDGIQDQKDISGHPEGGIEHLPPTARLGEAERDANPNLRAPRRRDESPSA